MEDQVTPMGAVPADEGQLPTPVIPSEGEVMEGAEMPVAAEEETPVAELAEEEMPAEEPIEGAAEPMASDTEEVPVKNPDEQIAA